MQHTFAPDRSLFFEEGAAVQVRQNGCWREGVVLRRKRTRRTALREAKYVPRPVLLLP